MKRKIILCCNRFQDALKYQIIVMGKDGVLKVRHPVTIKRGKGKVERIGMGYTVDKECIFCREPLKDIEDANP